MRAPPEAPRDELAVAPGELRRNERADAPLEHEHAGVDRGCRLERASSQPPRTADEYQAPQTTSLTVLGHGSARLTATPHSTITSARTNGTSGSSSRCRRIAVVRSNGRFATTRNGSLGSGRRAASPRT